MTPAILPNLLVCAPAQPAGVSETPGAAQGNAIDFSALLLELLPDSAPPAAPVVIPAEPQAANGKAETRGETEPEAPAEDRPSPQPDPAAAPVTMLAVPVPILLDAPAAASSPGESEVAPEGAGEVRTTGATEPAGIASTPDTDRQAHDRGPRAAPAVAGMPLPQGFETEAANSVVAIQPDAESRVSVEEERAPADSRAAGADPAPNAPKQGPRNAEMAFAARLTAPPQAPAAAARAPELHLAMPAEMRSAEPGAEFGPAAPVAAIPEPHVATPREMRSAEVETERGAPPPRAGAPPAPGPGPGLNQIVQRDRAPANVRPESVPAAGPSPAPEPAADMPPPVVERPEARAQQAPAPQAQARIDGDPEPQAEARAAQAEVKPRSAGSGGGTDPEQRPDRPGAAPHRVTGGEAPEAPFMHRSESAEGPVLRQSVPRERAAVLPAAQEAIELQPGRTEPARPQALRELSVVLPGRTSESGKAGPQVEIRVVERTGDVQIAVRTADSRLTSSLREDLPQLVSQLADRGYRTETWHPAAAAAAGEGRPIRTESSEPGRGGDNSGNPGRGGSGTAGRDGNGGRREQEEKQPEWLDALERSLGRDGAPIRRIL